MAEIGDVFPRRNLPDEAEAWGRHLEGHVRAVGKTLQQVKQAVDNSTRAASGISATISSQGVIIDGLISGNNSVSESVDISIQEANLAAEEARAAKDEAAASLIDARQALDGLGDLEEDLLDPATGKVTVALATANTAAQEAAQAQTDATNALNKALEAEGGVAGALDAVQNLEDELEPRITTAQQDANAAAQEAAQAKADALTAINTADDAAQDAQDAWNQALEAMGAAVTGGGNIYPDPSFEYGGAGLDANNIWEIIEDPVNARQGTHVATQKPVGWGALAQPTEYQPCSGADVAFAEAYVMRTDAAQTGEVRLNIQTLRQDGATGASNIDRVNLEDIAVGVWHKLSGTIRITTASGEAERTGWRVYIYAVSGDSGGFIIDSVRHTNVTQAYEALEAAQAAQDAASQAQSDATEAMTAADGKTRIWRSTLSPSLTNNPTGKTGDVWWRYSNSNFTGPITGQWTRKSDALDGWEPTQIESEVIANLTVDKLVVTGNAKFPTAVIDTLVSDNGFVNSLYANRVLVTPEELAPGPGGFDDVYDVIRGTIVHPTTAFDSTQNGQGVIRFNGGTSASGEARGPIMPVKAGQKYRIEAFISWYGSSTTGGYTELRAEWFGDPGGSRLSFSIAARREDTTGGALHGGTVTAPADARYGRFYIYTPDQSGAGDVAVFNISFKAQVGSVLIEDGAITGDKVNATSVAAELGEFIEVRASNIVGDTGAMNQAFIGQLVGDSAFISSLYTNQVIVDPGNLAPGVGGYESAWGLTNQAFFVTSVDPTGWAIALPIGTSGSAAVGPRIPVSPGLKIHVEFYTLAQSSPNANMNCRVYFYDKSGTVVENNLVGTVTATGWTNEDITVPSGARYAEVRFVTYNSSAPQGRWVPRQFNIRVQVGSVLIENGAITGDKVNAQSVAAAVGEFVEVRASRVIGDTGAMNAAFVGQLLSDAAYVDNFYANRIIVDSANMTPGPLGYESQYSLIRASIVNNSNSPTGRGFRFDGGTGNGQIYGPAVPVTAGLTYYAEAHAGFYISTSRGGNLELRIRWYDSKPSGTGGHISQSTLATLADGSASQTFGGSAEAPPGAKYGRAYFYVTNQSGIGDWAIVNSSFRAQTGSVLIQDGAITAPKIKSKAIEADHLSVGALDSFQITSPLIQSVSAANRGIKWDGSQFVGYNNSGVETFRLDAAQAKISGGAIEGATVTGGQLQTSRVGKARVVIAPLVDYPDGGGGIWWQNEYGADILTLATAGPQGDPGMFFIDDTGSATTGPLRGYLGKPPSAAGMRMHFRAANGELRMQLDEATNLGLSVHSGGRTSRVSSEGVQLAGSDGLIYTRLSALTGRLETWDKTGGGVWFHNIGTTTAAANMVSSTVDWKVLRSTSLRKYKLDIEPLDVDPYAILDVTPSTWFDKGQVQKIERDRKITEAKEAGVAVFDPEYKPWPEKEPRRIPGYIAEDMEAAGLGILCQYDGDGELTGISYDRISAALALAIRENKERIDSLERMMK